MTASVNPTIILNTGRFAARAAEVIKARSDWQHVKHWRYWQQNDDEGMRTTQVFFEVLGSDFPLEPVNNLYAGFKDLNKFWTDAPDQQRMTLAAQLSGNVPIVKKSYDTSTSAEARRTLDARRGPTNNPSFS